MNNNFLTIQEAANVLGVSTKTLRRWDKAGILVPNRTIGNQRRYEREKIEIFTRSKTLLYSPSLAPQGGFLPRTDSVRGLPKANPIQIATVASGACIFLILLGIHIGANVLTKLDIGKANLESTFKGVRQQTDQFGGKGLVLGEATPKNQVLLKINASSSFNNSAAFLEGIMAAKIATLSGGIITEDQDIDAGTGTLTASNVLYGATAGTGISIGTGQRPTITNTDLGSSQNIFKTIKVGSDSFSTGSNTDTLEFSAGTGISLSTDKSNKKVTITGSATSGWTDDGTAVRLTTSTDSVGIGLTSPSSKLDVLATTEQLRLLYDSTNYTSFTISSSGDLTLNPTGGDIIFADADVVNIGGSGSDTAYNIIGDSSTGASSVVDSDDDLYIEGNIEVDGTVRLNNVSYTFPSADGSNTNVLTTNGSGTLSWAASSGSNWSISSGAISPINSTLDLLIGGTASTSAKFAVLNINSGTPTASVSANSGNIATYLTGDGTLATTNRQSLTIGNSSTYNTTGNVLINSNGTGLVGIGTTAPTDLLTLRSDSAGATSSILRLENLGSATLSSGGGINYYANRTTGGSTNIIAMNGVITSIDNTNYQSRFDLRTAQAGALTTQLAVGGPNIQFNLPLDVNVGGDVGFNYDLMFLNTGTSFITSEGPLSILAGDANHIENLTLGTQGTGDVILDVNDSILLTGGLKVLGAAGNVLRVTPGGTIGASDNGRIVEVTGSFTEAASGTHTRIMGVEITAPTITGAAATVTDTASLYISGAPSATVAGANYALWIDGGDARFDGNVGIGDTTPDSLLDILSATTGTNIIITNTNATDTDVTVGFALVDGTNNFTLGVDDSVTGDPFKISTTALGTGDTLTIDSRTTTSGVSAITLSTGTAPTIASAATAYFNSSTFTPGTVNFSGSTQITSTGTSANNALLFNQPTINRTDAASNLTIDQASNLFINGPTIASHATVGQTETITASSALRIGAGSSVAGTRGVVTSAYGLYVDAPTGATDNYAAVFPTGRVVFGAAANTSTNSFDVQLANGGIARLGVGSVASAVSFTNGSILSQDSEFQIAVITTVPMVFYTGATGNSLTAGTERMRLTSTGLGIGDPSPDVLLDILSATTGTNIIITNTNATDTDVTVGFALVDGTNNFTLGVDDSVTGDPFKISTTALGTNDMLTLDSSTTTSGTSAITLAGIAPTIASAAGAEYTTLTVTPPTITLTLGTQVTSVMDSILINAPTITDTTAITIDKAATVTIAGNPTAGGSVTITAPRALNVDGRVEINLAGTQTSVALCGSHAAAGGASVSDVEIVDCTGTPAADYMEMYSVEQGVEPGDIVVPGATSVQTTTGDTLAQLIKSSKPYGQNIIGIVSDPKAAGDFNSIGYNIKSEDNPMPIALNGRVQVKVSLENGSIQAGDYLTSSSTPGVAMKATKPGMVVGMALEGFDGDDTSEVCSGSNLTSEVKEHCRGKILVFINPHWQDPSVYIAADGNLNSSSVILSESEGSDTLGNSSQASPDQNDKSLASDPLFKDLADKVGLLETRISELASTSALLSVILGSEATPESRTDSGQARMTIEDLDLKTATVSGTLMVLGRTTLADLGVTGNINSGLLSIHGLLDDTSEVCSGRSLTSEVGPCSGSTINTLSGNLYLQNEGLGGIDILNGKILIDKDGTLIVNEKITAKTIETEEFEVKGAKSIGTGVIESGKTSVEVVAESATSSSKIFITPTSLTSKQLAVTSKSDGKFRVEILEADVIPIKFDWWVVN